ncbi:pyridoxamine 5'-phosphate oxidase family protein [Pseudonocardia sp. DSM 110487]|uniref:pyridoxamine 5'-phosphate oxidase family protein n=1 Tax=Pseudonocardia sp. DSM 110487 TaxID=2865833 RepID=UPI001C6998D1|nr:pyridoxamine 5'-phosphate oxidase family protein [Pseudonocardia sp. DSM 110487]QYN38213.1 pyridoxamine 5'-phosphate oxidase family protein [Pseudonocardia sp. DSM 110487]
MTEFSEIREAFDAYVGDIVYATMTTVDAKGRPRARVLIPVWEVLDGLPLGWLATYRTPVKAAHLAGNPHTTFSYWSPRQNAVSIDTVAEWVEDLDVKARVWDLYRTGSPPGAGYNLGKFWKSPADPELHVLRLEPWRIQVIRGSDINSRIWRSPAGWAARRFGAEAGESTNR